MTEGTNMQPPRQIWDRVNVWSVLATMGGSLFSASCAVVAVTLWYASTNEKIDRLSEKFEQLDGRQERRAAQTDNNFKNVNDQLNGLPYRTGKIEQALEETNLRIDRQGKGVAEDIKSIGTDIKSIVAGQAESRTKIEVLGSQVETLSKSLANKIIWRETSIIPLLRYASIGSCTLPVREGFTTVKAHYRRGPPTVIAGN